MNPESELQPIKLTRFLCQELLYDYSSGQLDRERHSAVENYLGTCRDCQRELEKLEKGLAFTEQLSDVKLNRALTQALATFEPRWKKALRRWTLWSSRRGWKLLPYVFLVAFVGLTIVVLKPWKKPAVPQEITLAEQLKIEPDLNPPKPPPPVPASAPAPAKLAVPIAQLAAALPKPAPLAPPKPLAVKVAAATATRATTTPTPSTPKPDPKAIWKGSLTRGDLEVSDFANTWPIIRDKIVSLGGKAAGTVKLGWLRRPNESYFHFSLPKSNFEELQVFLKTFGPVRFVTQRHPRVMPPGQIRIILKVKDGDQHEGATEAP